MSFSLFADFSRPEGLLLKTFFALGRLVQSDEARYLQDNQAGRLPLFLEAAVFAVQELPQATGCPISPGYEAGSLLNTNVLVSLGMLAASLFSVFATLFAPMVDTNYDAAAMLNLAPIAWKCSNLSLRTGIPSLC